MTSGGSRGDERVGRGGEPRQRHATNARAPVREAGNAGERWLGASMRDATATGCACKLLLRILDEEIPQRRVHATVRIRWSARTRADGREETGICESG